MTETKLGRLEPVDLRACWRNEAADFTPWLAQEENIRLLAEALGIPELHVEETEAGVGPFRADILCSEPDSDGYVLIENQLERTDHRHLGQILTYAAGLDAVKVVWVSPEFTEEHRAALDWLNRISSEEFHFFGVQVELWRIGDSPMAPRFHLVVKPNEWRKRVKAGVGKTGGGNDEKTRENAKWWEALQAHLQAHGNPFRLTWGGPRTGSWSTVAGSPARARLVISHAYKSGTTRVYVWFRNEAGKKGGDAREWYDFALEHAAEIASAAQTSPAWTAETDCGYLTLERLDGKQAESSFDWLCRTVPPLIDEMKRLESEFDLRPSVEEED